MYVRTICARRSFCSTPPSWHGIVGAVTLRNQVRSSVNVGWSPKAVHGGAVTAYNNTQCLGDAMSTICHSSSDRGAVRVCGATVCAPSIAMLDMPRGLASTREDYLPCAQQQPTSAE